MNVPMLLLGLAIGAAAGGLIVWLVSLTRVARDIFASLSAEALRQNNQSFLALAQTKLAEFQLSASSDLEGRVLVSARRFRDLGVASEELPEAQTVQLGSRRLNAPEMTDASVS